MTKVATRQATAHFVESESSQYDHSRNRIGYLGKIHALLLEYENSAESIKQHLFAEMIHCFLQDLCGYPEDAYLVTRTTNDDETAGSRPHVVLIANLKNVTLFWFTTSDDIDDLHDLWVKHAQVYVNDPCVSDSARNSATTIIFTNFLVIDGAEKDIRNDAWELWSASDVLSGGITRIDLRRLWQNNNLDRQTLATIDMRLRSIHYQAQTTIFKG